MATLAASFNITHICSQVNGIFKMDTGSSGRASDLQWTGDECIATVPQDCHSANRRRRYREFAVYASFIFSHDSVLKTKNQLELPINIPQRIREKIVGDSDI